MKRGVLVQRSMGGGYSKLRNVQKAWRFWHPRHTIIGMITYLSALASLLSFRFRSRTSLELELLALRHEVTVLRRQRPGRLRLFCADLSFPKIISARTDDAARTEWAWRQWSRIAGSLAVAAHLCPATNAYTSH
jgi:hypothetical protein